MSVQQGPLDLAALRDTVCVVTGAGNGGIGYSMCEVAASLGMHVALIDLFEHIAAGAAAKLREAFPAVRVVSYACDVSQPTDLEAVVKSLDADFVGRRLGAVFANAGVVFPSASVLDLELSNVRKTMDVNVVGVVATMQAFVPVLRRSQEPSVFCTTASVGGLVFGMPRLSDYCASKHGAVNLTESLAAQLAQKAPQIRVHVCCPCLVKTPVGLGATSQAAKANDPSKVQPAWADNPIMDELFMTPTNHGRQVWDRIAAGEFYMICDNIRPYVDHDFPFGGADVVRRRVELLLKPDFQRSFDTAKLGRPAPLFAEAARRAQRSAKL